jgi:hypothetical protein
VAPGDSYSFTFALRAPTEAGTWVERFGLVEDMKTWFADQGGPADDVLALTLIVGDRPGDHIGGGGSDAVGSPAGGCSLGGGADASPSWALGLLLVAGLRRRLSRRA